MEWIGVMTEALFGKIDFSAFEASLKDSLAPVYLLCGEEPLQRFEASRLLLAAARGQGYGHRSVHHADPGIDWRALMVSADNGSLFGEKKMLELRFGNAKIPAHLNPHLMALVSGLGQDVVLLVCVDKVDLRTAWVKKTLQIGVMVEMKTKNQVQMRTWVRHRGSKLGLKLGSQVVNTIVENAENNMVEAARIVEILSLLSPDEKISLESLATVLRDDAKFDVFMLADAALGGECVRAVRILRRLEREKKPATLVLWVLADRLRLLVEMQQLQLAGKSWQTVLQSQWESRRKRLQKAFERRPRRNWKLLLHSCARIDASVKGTGDGKEWQELLELVLSIAGISFPLLNIR